MKILILEDNADRQQVFRRNLIGQEVTIVDQAQQAIQLLTENVFEMLFLDHDLGNKIFVDSFTEPNTGYAVAKWLEEHPDRQPKEIILHSLNPDGRKNMAYCLPKAQQVPFAWMLIKVNDANAVDQIKPLEIPLINEPAKPAETDKTVSKPRPNRRRGSPTKKRNRHKT